MKKNYSDEELREALEYFEKIDALEKGSKSEGFDESAETNGGKEERIAQLKDQIKECFTKAKEMQEELSKLEGEEPKKEEEPEKENELEKACKMKKGEEDPTENPIADSDEEGEEEEDSVEKAEDLEESEKESESKGKFYQKFLEQKAKEKKTKGQKKGEDEIQEMKKSLKAEILDDLKGSYEDLLKSKDNEIIDLKSRLESLENEPLRKSKKTVNIDYLQKAFSGERTENNNRVLSKRLHKGVIGQILFEAWNKETDEMRKAKYSEAVMQFESANGFLSDDIKEDLAKSHHIEIID